MRLVNQHGLIEYKVAVIFTTTGRDQLFNYEHRSKSKQTEADCRKCTIGHNFKSYVRRTYLQKIMFTLLSWSIYVPVELVV